MHEAQHPLRMQNNTQHKRHSSGTRILFIHGNHRLLAVRLACVVGLLVYLFDSAVLGRTETVLVPSTAANNANVGIAIIMAIRLQRSHPGAAQKAVHSVPQTEPRNAPKHTECALVVRAWCGLGAINWRVSQVGTDDRPGPIHHGNLVLPAQQQTNRFPRVPRVIETRAASRTDVLTSSFRLEKQITR